MWMMLCWVAAGSFDRISFLESQFKYVLGVCSPARLVGLGLFDIIQILILATKGNRRGDPLLIFALAG
jgi:hypothetical protein